MKTITVKTGFGYYINNGEVFAKAELPLGEHEMFDTYSYIEVATKEELDLIEIFRPAPTEKEIDEKKIADMIRFLAIAECKKQGILPQDFNSI